MQTRMCGEPAGKAGSMGGRAGTGVAARSGGRCCSGGTYSPPGCQSASAQGCSVIQSVVFNSWGWHLDRSTVCPWHGMQVARPLGRPHHPNRHHTREGAAAPPRKSSARQSLLLCYSRDRAFAWKQHPGAPGAAACAPGEVGVSGLPTSTWGRRARRTCPGARWPDLWHIAASGPSVSHSMPPRAPLAGLAVLKRVGCPSRRPRRTSPPPGRRRLWLQTTDAAGAGSSEACMPSIDAKHACMRRLGAAANICEGILASLLGGTHQGKMNLWPPG